MLSEQTIERITEVSRHLMAADGVWCAMTSAERRAVMRTLANIPDSSSLYQALNPRDWDAAAAGLAVVAITEGDKVEAHAAH